MSPLHPRWRENRKEHLSVNVSACDCTITLWYAELTQLMSLMAWRAKYHVRRKPLCVWARTVNLGWSPQHCKSSRVDRFNPVRAFYTKECRCSYRDRTVIQERAPDAFLQPTALFTKNDLIKKKMIWLAKKLHRDPLFPESLSHAIFWIFWLKTTSLMKYQYEMS